jgi:hypothetical protein
VRRLLIALSALAALAVAPPASAGHLPQRSCGLPAGDPLYVEFAEVSVPFALRRDIFGRASRPLVLATSQDFMHAELRGAGAHTVFWYMKTELIVGFTTQPHEPAEVLAEADRLYARAARETACPQPYIALNELHGAWTATPWGAQNADYRRNVLLLLQRLHDLGARPFLLVPTTPTPFTGSPEAVAWWREAARYGDLVLELHFDGRYIAAQGAIQASRFRRQKMRRVLEQFDAIGVPAGRLGLMHGFQSGPGAGGRERLRLSRWLDVVKWETLAAKQVIGERSAAGRPVGSVWSWGWGEFPLLSPADPEKPLVACVHLWARDPSLCDAPSLARDWATPFDASRSAGQLVVPGGVRCTVGSRPIRERDITQLASVRDEAGRPLGADTAYGILFRRLAEAQAASVSAAAVTAVEERLVVRRYFGRWTVYEEVLRIRGISRTRARQALADQARRLAVAARLEPGQTFAQWSQEAQDAALRRTTCAGDALPALGAAPLADRLRFLRL